MQKLFSRILLPVAFNRNMHWSVDKAVQLANKFGCDIFLLHAKPSSFSFSSRVAGFFRGSLFSATQEDLLQKMKTLENDIRPKLKAGLFLTSAITSGKWQSVLKDFIISEHIDLALIPRNQRRFKNVADRRININRLSLQTNCPILTITRNFNVNHLENVVVPVLELLPVKKLLVAHYLSVETGCTICLMGNNSKPSSRLEKGYLIKAYQLLNDNGKAGIHCAVRDNVDTAAATLAYAKDVQASLIVVNPGQESRMHGWLNCLKGKHLCSKSDIPVMTVAI